MCSTGPSVAPPDPGERAGREVQPPVQRLAAAERPGHRRLDRRDVAHDHHVAVLGPAPRPRRGEQLLAGGGAPGRRPRPGSRRPRAGSAGSRRQRRHTSAGTASSGRPSWTRRSRPRPNARRSRSPPEPEGRGRAARARGERARDDPGHRRRAAPASAAACRLPRSVSGESVRPRRRPAALAVGLPVAQQDEHGAAQAVSRRAGRGRGSGRTGRRSRPRRAAGAGSGRPRPPGGLQVAAVAAVADEAGGPDPAEPRAQLLVALGRARRGCRPRPRPAGRASRPAPLSMVRVELAATARRSAPASPSSSASRRSASASSASSGSWSSMTSAARLVLHLGPSRAVELGDLGLHLAAGRARRPRGRRRGAPRGSAPRA